MSKYVDKLLRVLPWLFGCAILVWFITTFSAILSPFFGACIVAYILAPWVDNISKNSIIARPLAVLLVICVLFISLFALCLLALLVIQIELPILREQMPALLIDLNNWLEPKLNSLGVNLKLDLPQLQKILRQRIAVSPDEFARNLIQTLLASGSALLQFVSLLIFLPLVLFYLLKDWHKLGNIILAYLPKHMLGNTLSLMAEIDAALAQYFRGQLSVMLALSSYYVIALWLAGFDVALPVGLLTGLAVFIPYLGFGVGLALALLGALLQFNNWYGYTIVATIYGIGQVAESFFLTPLLVGDRIGLHPLVVIFSLLAFAHLFGFIGLILALPASAVLLVILRHLKGRFLY